MKTPDIMTIAELAQYLRLARATVSELAEKGNIPGKKLEGHWRFHRAAVDRWLASSAEGHHGEYRSETIEAGFVDIESFDVVEHAELVGPWDVRLNQLSSGNFHSTLRAVTTPGMMIYEERWRRKAVVSGGTPEGYVMLGTNVAWRRSRIDWCGETVNDRHFACAMPGSEIDFKTPDRSHDVVVLVKPEILATAIGSQAVELLVGVCQESCRLKFKVMPPFFPQFQIVYFPG
jgi:excisionase family DNA binding protein